MYFRLLAAEKSKSFKATSKGLALSLTAEDIAEVENAYQFDPDFPQTILSGPITAGSDAWQKTASRASKVRLTSVQSTID